MVARNAECVAVRDHGHDAAQHTGAVGPAVDEVADEHRRAPFGVRAVHVTELAEQRLQLGAAAVDVTDDVEGAGEVAEVVVAALQNHFRVLGLLLGAQDVDLAEALALQTAQRAAQLPAVALDDVAGHVGTVRTARVAREADLFGQVEDDRDRQHVVLPGQLHQLTAALRLDVGGVDDGQPSGGQPLARDVVQDVEGVPAGALVVLVVGDEAAAEVRGDDLRRFEVPAGEDGLARAARPDEDDEGEVGHRQDASGAGAVAVAGAVAGAGVTHAAFASFSGASVVAVVVASGVLVVPVV